MTTLSTAELEFFELTNSLKNVISVPQRDSILKTLLKLNNPTYYSKYLLKNPIERHGFSSSRTINPILISVGRMIQAIRSVDNMESLTRALQIEISWAFHKYPSYRALDL